MSLDQGAQAEPLVQLAGPQQPSVGGHRRAMGLDVELGVEREVNRASFRVTHWVVPSVPPRSPLRAASCAGLERLWPGTFCLQIENVGLEGIVAECQLAPSQATASTSLRTT